MDAARNFAANNRSLIANVLYLAVAAVALYFLYKFLMGGDASFTVLGGESDGAGAPKEVALPGTTARIQTGGEYTLSFWMYITSWDMRFGKAKSVLQISDSGLPNYSLFTSILYPNEPRMMLRVHTEGNSASGDDYNNLTSYNALMNATSPSMSMDSPMCDLTDIDLQRWINITVSVNGRIVDVYYDGKLARSCVLPTIPVASDNGQQIVSFGKGTGFAGKLSNIQFFPYPLTPDAIYSVYMAGPRKNAGFLTYLLEKLGIKITYGDKKE